MNSVNTRPKGLPNWFNPNGRLCQPIVQTSHHAKGELQRTLKQIREELFRVEFERKCRNLFSFPDDNDSSLMQYT